METKVERGVKNAFESKQRLVLEECQVRRTLCHSVWKGIVKDQSVMGTWEFDAGHSMPDNPTPDPAHQFDVETIQRPGTPWVPGRLKLFGVEFSQSARRSVHIVGDK